MRCREAPIWALVTRLPRIGDAQHGCCAANCRVSSHRVPQQCASSVERDTPHGSALPDAVAAEPSQRVSRCRCDVASVPGPVRDAGVRLATVLAAHRSRRCRPRCRRVRIVESGPAGVRPGPRGGRARLRVGQNAHGGGGSPPRLRERAPGRPCEQPPHVDPPDTLRIRSAFDSHFRGSARPSPTVIHQINLHSGRPGSPPDLAGTCPGPDGQSQGLCRSRPPAGHRRTSKASSALDASTAADAARLSSALRSDQGVRTA